jgi:hypothetical protein
MIFVVWTILRDVYAEQSRLISENQDLINRCEKEFRENRCEAPERLPPAVVKYCNDRKDCVGQYPLHISRSAIAARSLGRLVNEFAGELSPRTVLTVVVILGGILWVLKIMPDR